MGIDISFTDCSLRNCSYALCAEHRSTPVEVTYNDSEKEIRYWEFRRIRRTEYKHTDILLPAEDPLFAYEYAMQKVGEEYPKELPEEMPSELVQLIRDQNKRDILTKSFVRWAEKQEFDKLVEWCLRQPDETKRRVDYAWYDYLNWEERRRCCRKCPVAPLDEDSCLLRFSNYPSMDYFKAGMVYLMAYAEKYKGQEFEPGPFDFPHLDRKKKETPRDKFMELWKYCLDAEPDKSPEEFFNRTFELLQASLGKGKKGEKNLELSGRTLSTADIPLVDEFLAKCIYRQDAYNAAHAELLLPILETIDELGEYARSDTRRREVAFAVEAFQYRLRQLVKALKMAKKFNIEFGMS